MERSRGRFSVPWDLHPSSLRATFAHNTDLIMALDSHAVPSTGAAPRTHTAASTPPSHRRDTWHIPITPPIAHLMHMARVAQPTLSHAGPTDEPVGVRADSPIGLGGGACKDTLHDAIVNGNVAEAIGRRRAPV